jgi:PhzF family phenazine biosynthesis protein
VRAYVVDAFTDAPFRGNPAGVVLLAAGDVRSNEWMQQVAAEFRHSETAFVAEREDGSVDLRWFTPAVEVDLCGHATLAAAHVLHTVSGLDSMTFHTRSGTLHASVTAEGIALDFPAQRTVTLPAPTGLADALGVDVAEVHSDGSDLVVDLPAADAVASLQPDLAALADIDCRGVVVTAPAAVDDHDFVSRFFGPRVGVPEDPVTGSAHCTLGPLWAGRLGRTTLVGVQLSLRGGRVGVDVRGDRVMLRGRAVTVLAGDLLPG